MKDIADRPVEMPIHQPRRLRRIAIRDRHREIVMDRDHRIALDRGLARLPRTRHRDAHQLFERLDDLVEQRIPPGLRDRLMEGDVVSDQPDQIVLLRRHGPRMIDDSFCLRVGAMFRGERGGAQFERAADIPDLARW